jgi:isoquinoline 1-oxidoreductase subunit beta
VVDSPYLKSVPAALVSLHSPPAPVTVQWWRSVGHSHTAFATESFIDEIAHAGGHDTVELRRLLFKDHPRHARVLEAVAERAGWGKPAPAGQGRGVAVHASFDSFVAQIADVSVEKDRIRVHRVICAIDCGLAVNPAGVAAQMQSGIVFGLAAAQFGALHIKNGRVQESNFDDTGSPASPTRRASTSSSCPARTRWAAPASPARRRSRRRSPMPSSI